MLIRVTCDEFRFPEQLSAMLVPVSVLAVRDWILSQQWQLLYQLYVTLTAFVLVLLGLVRPVPVQ